MKNQGVQLIWIVVNDLEKAITFYTEVLGFTLENKTPEYGWAELSAGSGAKLGIAASSHENGMPAGTNAVITIAVENLTLACESFVKNGGTVVGDIIEIPGHVKMQSIVDADGNSLQLVQQL